MSNTTAIGSTRSTQCLPGRTKLGGLRRGIPPEPGLGERRAVWKHDTVEREAQELGEAGLARAIEARDPRRGQLWASGPGEVGRHVGEQPHVLLVNAPRHTRRGWDGHQAIRP